MTESSPSPDPAIGLKRNSDLATLSLPLSSGRDRAGITVLGHGFVMQNQQEPGREPPEVFMDPLQEAGAKQAKNLNSLFLN